MQPALRTDSSSAAISRALAAALDERLGVTARPLVRFEAGQVVIGAGLRVERLAVLRSGRIDAVMHSPHVEGRQVVPVQFGPGEIVMLSYLFSTQLSTVDMVAAEPSSLCWLKAREIEAAMLAEPALAVLLIRFLSARLRDVQARERAWLERSVSVRVAAALVRMAGDPLANQDEGLIIATHEIVAQRAGVSRPKASRALKEFEHRGWLRQGRGRLNIVDGPALIAYSG